MDQAIRYDAFISYRHGERDEEFARDLFRKLEADGYKVAIDKRDFAANENFLLGMERCVKESRFTIAVISPRYRKSGNCAEEAIMTKVLDMADADQKPRLIPVIVEKVEVPLWIYNIAGVDYTETDPLVDPYERLKGTLGNPL